MVGNFPTCRIPFRNRKLTRAEEEKLNLEIKVGVSIWVFVISFLLTSSLI